MLYDIKISLNSDVSLSRRMCLYQVYLRVLYGTRNIFLQSGYVEFGSHISLLFLLSCSIPSSIVMSNWFKELFILGFFIVHSHCLKGLSIFQNVYLATQKDIAELVWELLSHAPISPDLALFDYCCILGNYCAIINEDEMERSVENFKR